MKPDPNPGSRAPALLVAPIILLAVVLLIGCGGPPLMGEDTYYRAVPLDAITGYFPTFSISHQLHSVIRAPVVINRKVHLARYHGNVVVSAARFWTEEIRYTGAFRHVMTRQAFEKAIIRSGLSQRIGSVGGLLALHQAYQAWGPFLWIYTRLNTVSANRHGMHEAELIVVDPRSGHKLFVARERFHHYTASSVSDQTTFYPLLNSLIDWIRENGGVLHPVRHLKQASSGR